MNRSYRILLTLLIAIILLAPVWWNSGPVLLDQIDADYIGMIRNGRLAGRTISPEGVLVFKNWIETHTRADFVPWNIIWQHFWYNAICDGYSLQIWTEPLGEFARSRNYAVYQSGKIIFLRIEYDGWNQVLRADFSPEELETALEKYLNKVI